MKRDKITEWNIFLINAAKQTFNTDILFYKTVKLEVSSELIDRLLCSLLCFWISHNSIQFYVLLLRIFGKVLEHDPGI